MKKVQRLTKEQYIAHHIEELRIRARVLAAMGILHHLERPAVEPVLRKAEILAIQEMESV
ncbi:MAG TPA: hypothetical protein PKD12_15620 [Nitrospira sp.]|nr:hypothetical protein [Nitrospira sp.]